MATLPLLESGRVGFTQVRNAVLPEIRVPQIDPIASRQMAQDAASIDVAAAIAPSSVAAEQIQSSPKKSLSSSAEADASTAGTSLL